MPDHIRWDHNIVLNRLRFAPANLLLASGHAHFTQMNDHEGSGSIDFHVSLHNPDPTRTVTVTRLRFIPASAGGWATQTPDSKGSTFAALLAPIGPMATASADVTGWVFSFNAYALFAMRAETSDGYYQDLLLQLPITITPSIDAAPFPPGTAPSLPTGAPRLVPIEAPVLLTLHEPVEAIVIERGDVTWIPLTGQVTAPTMTSSSMASTTHWKA